VAARLEKAHVTGTVDAPATLTLAEAIDAVSVLLA